MFDVAASNKTTPHSMQLYRIFVKIKMSSMSRLLILYLFSIHYGNFPKFWLNTSLNWWNQFHYHATIHKQIILSAFFIISIPNLFDFRFQSQMSWINGMKINFHFIQLLRLWLNFCGPLALFWFWCWRRLNFDLAANLIQQFIGKLHATYTFSKCQSLGIQLFTIDLPCIQKRIGAR